MNIYTNCNFNPSSIYAHPWLYEKSNETIYFDCGKWMLYYNKFLIDEAWKLAKNLHRNNKLDDIISMKCSTNYTNLRTTNHSDSVIILYCNDSSNENKILDIGKKIIELFKYKENNYIYYKTDLQTDEGTYATGNNNNYTYKLINFSFEKKHINRFKIERFYPNKKEYITYPLRYDEDVFKKAKKMKKDVELLSDYEKWKNGINYKTNRKIQIDGKMHTNLGDKFIIKFSCCHLSDEFGKIETINYILFDDIISINKHKYLKKTKMIIDEINKNNTEIKKYNLSVNNIIDKIKKLQKWNDFIEFNGIKYGLDHKIINNIHIENDCNGEMKYLHDEDEYICRDRPFCNDYSDITNTYSVFKCNNCNYMEKKLNLLKEENIITYQKLDSGGNKN